MVTYVSITVFVVVETLAEAVRCGCLDTVPMCLSCMRRTRSLHFDLNKELLKVISDGGWHGRRRGIDPKTSGVEGAIYIYPAILGGGGGALRSAECDSASSRSDGI